MDYPSKDGWGSQGGCQRRVLRRGHPPDEPAFHITHRDLRIILRVYVDDFKMIGPAVNMNISLPLVRGVIAMDAPPSLKKYLGRGHEHVVSGPSGCDKDIARRPVALSAALQD